MWKCESKHFHCIVVRSQTIIRDYSTEYFQVWSKLGVRELLFRIPVSRTSVRVPITITSSSEYILSSFQVLIIFKYTWIVFLKLFHNGHYVVNKWYNSWMWGQWLHCKNLFAKFRVSQCYLKFSDYLEWI